MYIYYLPLFTFACIRIDSVYALAAIHATAVSAVLVVSLTIDS